MLRVAVLNCKKIRFFELLLTREIDAYNSIFDGCINLREVIVFEDSTTLIAHRFLKKIVPKDCEIIVLGKEWTDDNYILTYNEYE